METVRACIAGFKIGLYAIAFGVLLVVTFAIGGFRTKAKDP